MQNPQPFLDEVSRRLTALFRANQQGVKPSPQERHRLEGFMQAGVFMELTSNQELSELMERIHQQVFGLSIAERRQQQQSRWPEEEIDFSRYEQPAYQRTPTPR